MRHLFTLLMVLSITCLQAQVITTPPGTNLRTMAEWEESQGYLITWTTYQSMLREIVRYGREECTMYIVSNNANNVITSLLNNGIDTSNVVILNTGYNSVWARDYGQWSAYTNDVDSLVFIDWIYNRPSRPLDNLIPHYLAGQLGVPVYETSQAPYNIIHTGGNFMVDGMGTGFSSKLILDENPSQTETGIDSVMALFMGLNRYIKMEKLPYDGIHHIDMHMKLLDEETIMMAEYPAGIADGPQIEANLQYVLNNFNTPYGNPYRVVRIPSPDDNGTYPNNGGDYLTYTNASFINKTIIVPTYNVSEDTTALRIWRESCPGYRVVGINSTSSISASGALHCITKEIGTNDPLLITHERLRDTYNTTNPYVPVAKIQHRSGITSATLYYTTDTNQAYTPVAMIPFAGPPDLWRGEIPAQPAGTEVFYYIQAEAASGKQQVRPIVAPEGFYNFKVLNNVSVNDIGTVASVKEIFPNPSKGITCLPVITAQPQTISVEMLDITGRKIQDIYKGETRMGDNKYFVNTSDFASGTYLVKYTIAGKETIKKLIVK